MMHLITSNKPTACSGDVRREGRERGRTEREGEVKVVCEFR